MPIYEYSCKSCGRITEILQKFSDPPLSACESCGGPVHKLISNNSFHLKGGGWYTTDYTANKCNSEKQSSTSANNESACKSCCNAQKCDSSSKNDK